jgi:copper homeostasis protein (lipoprotein)
MVARVAGAVECRPVRRDGVAAPASAVSSRGDFLSPGLHGVDLMRVLCAAALTASLLLTACSAEAPPSENDERPAAPGEASTSSPDTAHNSRNSLDWPGRYHGITPCADCEGIETTVTLRVDGTFERQLDYLGRTDVPVTESGAFTWDDAGASVTLGGADGQRYQVGENVLFHLDRNGSRIEGDLAAQYRLEMTIRDPALEGHRWVLSELHGQPVTTDAGVREAFITFNGDDGQVNGNNSCNAFFGPYLVKPGYRIRFQARMGMTMMACPEGSHEQAFMGVLQQADNYAIADGVLSLNRARMAPLARFTLTPPD